jgi:hypothetical protein
MKITTPRSAHSFARSPMSRRSLLVSMIAVPLLAVAVTACGDDSLDTGSSTPGTAPPDSMPGSVPPATDGPVGGAIDHPTGADEVVIRFGHEGGFVAPGTLFVNVPSVLIAGDGRVYTPGVTTMEFPGPMLQPMSVRTITEAGIQKLLAAADAAGLLAPPPDYSAELNVADVQDTVVTLTAGGATYTHSAYALGFQTDDQGNQVPETTPARAALQEFTLLLGDLAAAVGADQLGPETLFVPTDYRMQATPIAEADLAGIDPAPSIIDWPATTGLDLATASECALLPADAAGSVFADANSNTFFKQGDALYRISVAGVLPGDRAC